jgi:thiol-disulfide isomerase/thioredoxin
VPLRRDWLIIALVALVAAAAGMGYNVWRTGSGGVESAESVSTLLTTPLPDLDNRAQSIDQWRGKVVVVNFWATWCAPCREEIPLFVRLQKQYGERGVQFVGIAIDQPAKVKPYAAELGMNFPILIGGADAIELTRKLGNRAAVLPFTLVITRQGKVVETHVGVAREAKLEALLASLL